MKIELIILIAVGALAAGVAIGSMIWRRFAGASLANAESEAKLLLEGARQKAELMVKEADITVKDVVLEAKAEWEKAQPKPIAAK